MSSVPMPIVNKGDRIKIVDTREGVVTRIETIIATGVQLVYLDGESGRWTIAATPDPEGYPGWEREVSIIKRAPDWRVGDVASYKGVDRARFRRINGWFNLDGDQVQGDVSVELQDERATADGYVLRMRDGKFV